MTQGRSGLVDIHAHFLTDDYLEAAQSAGHHLPDGMPQWPTWNLAEQVESMRRRNIRRAILTISSPGVYFGDEEKARALAVNVNDAAAEIVGKQPQEFGFFASLPLPDIDASVQELIRSFALGASGITIESNIDGNYLGDPSLEPLWAELDRRHGVLFMHPTSPVGWERFALGRPSSMLEFMFESTRTIADLILAGVTRRYPNMKVVVPHSGATLPILNDRIQLFEKVFGLGGGHGNWTEEFSRLWFDMAGTPFPTQIPFLEALVGHDQIVYGSDSCFSPSALVDQQISTIDAADSPEGFASWRELTSRNAANLLRLAPLVGGQAETERSREWARDADDKSRARQRII